jgi:hypothetical protein
MTIATLESEGVAPTGAHFQMFLHGRPPMVRWRLLSGNNRDMCHSVEQFDDPEECSREIRRFVAQIGQLDVSLRRGDQGDWTWMLLMKSRPVAESGHSYDRKIRCSKALANVLRDAPQAVIRPQLLVSDHRRWPGSSRAISTSTDGPARRVLSS